MPFKFQNIIFADRNIVAKKIINCVLKCKLVSKKSSLTLGAYFDLRASNINTNALVVSINHESRDLGNKFITVKSYNTSSNFSTVTAGTVNLNPVFNNLLPSKFRCLFASNSLSM